MKVFLLIHEQDTDAAWGANVDPFISLEAAQAAMQKSYEDSIKSWDFDATEQTDKHYSECLEKSAVLRDDSDVEKWQIEEKELDVQVAIKVEGGRMRAIYKAVLSHLLCHYQKYGLTGKQKSQLESIILKF